MVLLVPPPFAFSEADRIGITKAIRCDQTISKKITKENFYTTLDDIQAYCKHMDWR
jgi:hypothetical protein